MMNMAIDHVAAEELCRERGIALRVCFVCTGNTCRSPMAQALASATVATVGKKDALSVSFFSAGLYAEEGEPISVGAIEALTEAGLQCAGGKDYRLHTAHTLGEAEAESYDLLVGMTSRHALELIMRFPQMAERILCFPREIPDPYGGDLACYRACLERMRGGMEELLKQLGFDTNGEGKTHGNDAP